MPTVCQFLQWLGSTSADICSVKDAITKGAVQNIGPVQQHPLQFALRNLRCLPPWPHVYIVMNGPRTCFRPWLLCVEIRRAGVRKLTSKPSKIYAWKGQLINLYLSTLNANKRRWTLYFILQDISTGNGVLPFWEVLPLPKRERDQTAVPKEGMHAHICGIHPSTSIIVYNV